ncbi:MAG: glycine cleavage system protein GcvH [Rickettsiales bacterium]|jgi:glycine cleavage system H protein|nr:glycine cleavage system protein GcvH [Rickettsiales bacterium]
MTDFTKTPENYKYTKNHEWVHQDEHSENNIYIVGITHHAQEALGDIVHVELPSIGSEFKVGDEIAVVESAKSASEVYAPISGIVTAVNDQLDSNPEHINDSPYGEGWMVKMQIDDPDQISDILGADGYTNYLEEEV